MYKLILNPSNKTPKYKQITDEEINLVNTEMKPHTAFIEDKIKEIQAQ